MMPKVKKISRKLKQQEQKFYSCEGKPLLQERITRKIKSLIIALNKAQAA